jgi:hypothetical protein
MTNPLSPAQRKRPRPIWIPDIRPGDNALDAALKYSEAGWRVVPTERDSQDHNSIVKDAVTNASRDPQQIAEWFLGNDFAIIAVCDVAETYVANPSAIPSAAHVVDAEAMIAGGGLQE